MGNGQAAKEIARMAQEMQESVGWFAGLDVLLRSALPRLADPGRDAEFNAAVRELTEQLDESAVHQLSMLMSELWLYWNTVQQPGVGLSPTRPDAPGGALGPHDRSSLPDILETVVNLAALAILGNRADALLLRTLTGARDRWRARRQAPDTPLTQDEAVDVGRVVAAIEGFVDDVELLRAELRDDGTWLVRFIADGRTLTLVLPPGDPGRARVVIRVS